MQLRQKPGGGPRRLLRLHSRRRQPLTWVPGSAQRLQSAGPLLRAPLLQRLSRWRRKQPLQWRTSPPLRRRRVQQRMWASRPLSAGDEAVRHMRLLQALWRSICDRRISLWKSTARQQSHAALHI